jgi:hypothetical protein
LVGSQTLFLIPFKKSKHPINKAAFIIKKYLIPLRKGKCILMFAKNLSKIKRVNKKKLKMDKYLKKIK